MLDVCPGLEQRRQALVYRGIGHRTGRVYNNRREIRVYG